MGGIACFPSLLLLFPHTCLGWISKAYFVRVFLFLPSSSLPQHGVAHLTGCSSGNRLPVITVAFVNSDTHQALPPPPLSSSFTSAVFNNLCSWELEWCFGVMEACGLHIGTSGWSLMIWDMQEVILVTGADSLLIWNSSKYVKFEVAEQKSPLHISQDRAPCYFPVWKADSPHLVNSQVWEYLLEQRAHLQAIWEVPGVSEYCCLKSNVSVIVGIEETQEQHGFVKSLYSRSSSLFSCI